MSKFLVSAVLVIILLLTSWALLRPGMFPTHDFVHGARIIEMWRGLSGGEFPVRWSAHFGYGYGMPLFQFYGPLPYYVGSLLLPLVAFNLAVSTKLLMFISSLGTLFFGYQLGKTLFKSRLTGILVASAITLAPYRAVNLYVRGAINESWGMMGLVWTLFGMVLVYRQKRWGVVHFALGLFVMATSHNLVTIISFPMIVLLVLVFVGLHIWKNRQAGQKLISQSASIVARYVMGGLFGIGLSSFYIFPAFFEKDYTQVEKFVTSGFFGYVYHFLYIRQFFQPNWGYGGSVLGPDDDMSFFLGYGQLLALGMFGLIALNILVKRGFIKAFREQGELLVLGGSLSLLLILSLGVSLQHALPFWDQFSGLLAFVQFPWRFLNIAVVLVGMLAGVALSLIKSRMQRSVLAGVLLVVLFLNAGYFQPKNSDDVSEAHYNGEAVRIQTEMSGILEDYIPKDFQQVPDEAPPAIVTCLDAECILKASSERAANNSFVIESAEPNRVLFRIASYPNWQVRVNNEPQDYEVDERGRIIVSVPAGETSVRLKLENTPLRDTADSVSAITQLAFMTYVSALIIKKRV